MKNQVWHIVWNTHGIRPPQHGRGDWARLSTFYSPIIAQGSVVVSHALQSRYSGHVSESVLLSEAELAQLCEWLLELTKEDGDRVAGGHQVLAAAFSPTQAHIFFYCDRESLSQVVGRLKSRLAALMLFSDQRRMKKRNIWSRGFWTAEILEDNVVARVRTFVLGLEGTVCGNLS